MTPEQRNKLLKLSPVGMVFQGQLFRVHRDGRVFRTFFDKRMKQWVTRECASSRNGHPGYIVIVGLPLISKRRLIAYCYVPNPDPVNRTYVSHIDCDSQNFHARNLAWTKAAGQFRYGAGVQKSVTKKGERVRWRARISVNSRLKSLGYFDRREDAVAAVRAVRKEIHGVAGNLSKH